MSAASRREGIRESPDGLWLPARGAPRTQGPNSPLRLLEPRPTGFLWSEDLGLIDLVEYMSDHGVEPDPGLNYLTLNGVSDDGRTMVGIAQETAFPFALQSFLLHCEADADGNADGAVDLQDASITGLTQTATAASDAPAPGAPDAGPDEEEAASLMTAESLSPSRMGIDIRFDDPPPETGTSLS